jgi:hypothetical protein
MAPWSAGGSRSGQVVISAAFVASEIDNNLYAVVNVKSFENVDVASLSSTPENFY